MKKKLVCVLIVMIFLAGCGVMNTKRKVTDNALVSPYPKLKVTFAPEFKYIPLKSSSLSYAQSSRDPSNLTDITYDRFYFISTDSKAKEVNKVIGIVFLNLFGQNWYIESDLFSSGYNVQKINNEDYQYVIYYGSPSEVFEPYVKKEGYTFSSGMFLFAGNKLNRKLAIYIIYYEKLSTADYKNLLEEKAKKSGKAQAYLEEFNKRFLSSFEMKNE